MIKGSPIFIPTNLYGLQLWLDATRQAVGAVASWADQSGNSNNATQGTGANQPTCTANQQNGKNGLVFLSASSQRLVLPSALYTIPNGDSTLFCVSKQTTGTLAVNALISMSKATASRYILRYGNNDAQVSYRSRNSNASSLATNGTSDNSQIITAFRSGTTESLAINNGTPATDASGSSEPAIDSAYIGSEGDGTVYLNGIIFEIALYNRAHSSAEIIAVNRYLSQKWGIAIS